MPAGCNVVERMIVYAHRRMRPSLGAEGDKNRMKTTMIFALLLILGCESVGTDKETETQNSGRLSIQIALNSPAATISDSLRVHHQCRLALDSVSSILGVNMSETLYV